MAVLHAVREDDRAPSTPTVRGSAREYAAAGGDRLGARRAGAGPARLLAQVRLSPGAVIGLSGGIDSAVTCALAARGAGARERAWACRCRRPIPRRAAWTTRAALAENLGIDYQVMPIATRFRPTWRRWPSRLPAPSPTWPRRTSRRASAATSSWRSPTSSATWCCPPATRASWRSATARSTAT